MWRLRLYYLVPVEIFRSTMKCTAWFCSLVPVGVLGPGWNTGLELVQIRTRWGFSVQSEMCRLRYSLIPVEIFSTHAEMYRLVLLFSTSCDFPVLDVKYAV
jgi:hypothetical protein